MTTAPAVPQRVLLVEDDRDISHMLQLGFTRLLPDVEVYYAGDGHQALGMLTDDGPWDLVICDMMMPQVDGSELVRSLVERGGSPDVVVLSAVQTERLAETLDLPNVVHHEQKPVELVPFLDRVRALLKG